MESLIGLILSLVMAGFAIIVGIDRDRSFYPTVLIGKIAWSKHALSSTGESAVTHS